MKLQIVLFCVVIVCENCAGFVSMMSNCPVKINHKLAEKLKYPFVVAVFHGTDFVCTGTLLSTSWVLSAASSVTALIKEDRNMKVRLGSYDKKKRGLLLPVQEIRIHPDYKYGLPEYDIAMIRLTKPTRSSPEILRANTFCKINYTSTRKSETIPPKENELLHYNIPMWTNDVEIGYGSSLHVSRYDVMKRSRCQKFLKSFDINLTKNMICLSPTNGTHWCKIGVGGPLTIPGKEADRVVRGIVSDWNSIYCDNHPIIAVRLCSLPIRSWIRRNLGFGPEPKDNSDTE